MLLSLFLLLLLLLFFFFQRCHVDYIFNNTIFLKGAIRPENKQNFLLVIVGNSVTAVCKSVFFLLLLLSSPEQSCFSCLPSLIFF